MNTERIVGLTALAFAGIYYYFASEIPRSLLADSVGADGLPKAYAVALGLLALTLVARSLKAPAGVDAEPEAPSTTLRQHLRAFGLLGLGAGYLLLVASAGYVLTMTLLIGAMALYCGAALDWRLFVISGVGGGLFWFVFVKMFEIPLPSGTWWRWFTG